jgi:pimeloyl-ACP methyl ester carboxylesterase
MRRMREPLLHRARCAALRVAAALACAAFLPGCVSGILARKIVTAPNQTGLRAMGADEAVLKHAEGAYKERWMVETDSGVKLSVATIEPGDYRFHYDFKVVREPGKHPRMNANMFWRTGADIVYSAAAPRGTIVLLHGYLERKEYMVPWAVALAEAGYRCVLIDHRGHGASTGDFISFGAHESRDVSRVLDDLARRGWDVSRVGVLGVSYGSSVGILAAGRDPRIATIVAFEPFSSAETAVPELTRAVFGKMVKGISDGQFAAAHRQEAKIAGFRWEDADIPAALGRTKARVFFIHGAADTWLAPRNSETLHAHAKPGSRLLIVPDENHVTLRMQIEPFRADVLAWFARGLGGDAVRSPER